MLPTFQSIHSMHVTKMLAGGFLDNERLGVPGSKLLQTFLHSSSSRPQRTCKDRINAELERLVGHIVNCFGAPFFNEGSSMTDFNTLVYHQ